MAWIEKRKNGAYRLRDRIDGKRVAIVKDLGIWRQIANDWLTKYEKALKMNFQTKPGISVGQIEQFIHAKERGIAIDEYKRIPFVQMVDMFIAEHGPSIKGGVSTRADSAYYGFDVRMRVIKRFFTGRQSDEVSSLDVRDFLATFKTIGTRMRYLGSLGKIFAQVREWNQEGNVLPFKIKIPSANPAKTWRGKMKPGEKHEEPDTRVLSRKEWGDFKRHLRPRSLLICEVALRRFLRLADIKQISNENFRGKYIRGRQQKTGDVYAVPSIEGHPAVYDFTNFERDFKRAQRLSGMDWPTGHPLHFTPRTLRRTGATWAYQKTKDIYSISKMLGHKNIKTTERYLGISHADLGAVALAVDQMAASDVIAEREALKIVL
jgi:integrase